MTRTRAIEINKPSAVVLLALDDSGDDVKLLLDAKKELSAQWERSWGNRAERLAIFTLYDELKQKERLKGG